MEFIITHAELIQLTEALKHDVDAWHGLEVGGKASTMIYSNVVYMMNSVCGDDYVNDWNRSVRYLDDRGNTYECMEASVTVTALGFETIEVLTTFGELRENHMDFRRERYLVKTPMGKTISSLQELLTWVHESRLESFGQHYQQALQVA
jgi:hypothetical protein